MSAKKFAKDSREWQMFVDYWNLCQKHWDIEYTKEYWNEAAEDAIRFGEKYREIPLAKKIAVAFLESLQEKSKKIVEEREQNGK
jgi:hypothetical protein